MRHKLGKRETLYRWFRVSECLNLAREQCGLLGERFIDFANQNGLNRSTALELVKLHQHRAAILSRCLEEEARATASGDVYNWPCWRAALSWFEKP